MKHINTIGNVSLFQNHGAAMCAWNQYIHITPLTLRSRGRARSGAPLSLVVRTQLV